MKGLRTTLLHGLPPYSAHSPQPSVLEKIISTTGGINGLFN